MMSQSPILIIVMLCFFCLLRDARESATILPSLTMSMLAFIHARATLTHCLILRNDDSLSFSSVMLNLMSSCVSSAYG